MINRNDIGLRVQDAHGRTGILRDIDPAWEDPSDPLYDLRPTPGRLHLPRA